LLVARIVCVFHMKPQWNTYQATQDVETGEFSEVPPIVGSKQRHANAAIAMIMGISVLILVAVNVQSAEQVQTQNLSGTPLMGSQLALHPGNWLFTQSWSPGFCHSSNYKGCRDAYVTKTQREHLTIHGLWYQEATMPNACTRASLTIQDVNDLLQNVDKFAEYYVNEQSPIVKGNDGQWELPSDNALSSSLWNHEWKSHGKCSGWNPVDYFTQIIALATQFDDTDSKCPLPPRGGQDSVAYQDLLDYYGQGDAEMVVLQCDIDTNQLAELDTCWSYDGEFHQIKCSHSEQTRSTSVRNYAICEPTGSNRILVGTTFPN